MDCIKKIKTFSLASSSPHFLVQDICCIFVLGTWVTRWKEKKQSTSQSIIGALQNIPSVGQMKRTQACWIRKTHTHMHAKFLAHEGNQNVEIPRASNPIQHTFKPRVCVLCAYVREIKDAHNYTQNLLRAERQLQLPWYWLTGTLLFVKEEYCWERFKFSETEKKTW